MALHACVDEAIDTLAPPGLPGTTCGELAPRVIKRYGNRKLYDTVASRYVKLEEVAELVRLGVDLRVVDHPTGRDLTTVALAHIIFSEELRDSTRGCTTLVDVLRGGSAEAPVGGRHGRARGGPVDLEATLHAAERRVHRLTSQGHRMRVCASEMSARSDAAVERLQRIASERIDAAHDVVAGLARLKTELSRIARRIDVLHERLVAIEG